ncbi:Shedu anti-phage system protein SduA domain-containing protein [Desulfosediminicola flagellatus]|uniref:Shedu anti-phage system protein SduA domain-containing protein n=1 Tax=Desulfosediminicola flagellatus TaxID=2569541 RepID=UPI0010AC675B|nr:Shedu anti-phage system protein SduA domain-containing protein [Desulfosediminicola flagellatus]
MRRQEIENALNGIDILLENHIYEEKYYQEWFEENPIIFDLLGFDKVIPHAILKTERETFIPDFIARDIDSLWSIVEIKRPDTTVLKSAKRRKEFYSSFREYISQCHEYNEFFDEALNRDSFKTKYNEEIHKNLKAFIIAGRNDGLDKFEIQKILYREGGKTQLKTYDDIRNYLEYHWNKNYSKFDSLKGFTICSAVKIHKHHDVENFIFDFGNNPHSNRASLYIDKDGTLNLRVIDGLKYTHLVKIKEGSHGFNYNEPIYILFELGVTAESTIITLEINGEHFKDIIIDNVNFDDSCIFDKVNKSYMNLVVGSDLLEKAKCLFELGEIAIYGLKVPFKDKTQIRMYYWANMETMEFPIFLGKSKKYGISKTHRKYYSGTRFNVPHHIKLIPF